MIFFNIQHLINLSTWDCWKFDSKYLLQHKQYKDIFIGIFCSWLNYTYYFVINVCTCSSCFTFLQCFPGIWYILILFKCFLNNLQCFLPQIWKGHSTVKQSFQPVSSSLVNKLKSLTGVWMLLPLCTCSLLLSRETFTPQIKTASLPVDLICTDCNSFLFLLLIVGRCQSEESTHCQ